MIRWTKIIAKYIVYIGYLEVFEFKTRGVASAWLPQDTCGDQITGSETLVQGTSGATEPREPCSLAKCASSHTGSTINVCRIVLFIYNFGSYAPAFTYLDNCGNLCDLSSTSGDFGPARGFQYVTNQSRAGSYYRPLVLLSSHSPRPLVLAVVLLGNCITFGLNIPLLWHLYCFSPKT